MQNSMTPVHAPAFAAAPALSRAAARGRQSRCERRVATPRAAVSPDARATAAAPTTPTVPAPAIAADTAIGGANGLDAELAPAVESFADVDEIVRLADEFDLADLRIESDGVCVEITREGGRGFVDGVLRDPPVPVVAAAAVGPMQMPQQQWVEDVAALEGGVQDVVAAAVEGEDEEDEEDVEREVKKPSDPNVVYDSDFVVTSNRVGYFFSGARNKPPLVNVGDHVGFNQPVCIIEQLGQQYVYLSEVSGTVTKIFVEDGDAVQYDQQVMVIRPD